MNYLEQLAAIAGKLPMHIWEDIRGRIADWTLGGGDPNHPYIGQQLRYARNVIASMEAKGDA